MQECVLDLPSLTRICRDLAWSELRSMPSVAGRLGARTSTLTSIDWSASGMALDSLACMQMATAGGTWCNAFETGYEDLFLAKRNVPAWAAVMHRVAQSGGTHITFSSSGTTGVRKHIRHRLSALMQEAHVWAELLSAANGNLRDALIKRVVLLAPTHHIYGFIWGVLLPMALKVPVIDADLEAFPELLAGDLVVAVPDQWTWLAAAHHLLGSWPAGVKGITSTAPLPAQVHRRLTDANRATDKTAAAPLARLLHVYGSAETAGLAWRDDPEQPYTLAAMRVRTPKDGIALRRPDGVLIELAIQDELSWVDDQHFYVVARIDQSVQVGGHNVSPAWVSAQLASHPNVQEAAVRLNSSTRPPRLKAFIVLKQADQISLRTQLETWAHENLPWYASPGSFTYGASLPRNSMGKLCDWPA